MTPSSPSLDPRPPAIGPFVSVAVVLFTSLFFRPIHDVDIFWQLKLGELSIQKQGLIAVEPFLAPRLGEPHVPVYWLSQVAYAAVFRFGGWEVLRFVDAALWFLGFLFALVKRRDSKSVTAVAMALVLGYLAAVPFQSIRAQSFAVFAFGLLICLVRGNRSTITKLALGIPLLVVWQNLHPSVIVGAVYLVCVTGAGLVRTVFRREPVPWTTAILMVAAGLATMATPAGPILLELSRVNGAVSIWMRTPEWLPIFAPENRAACLGPALVIAITVGLAIRFRSRIRIEELLPALAFAALTIYALRFAVFFGVAAIPFLATLLTSDETRSATPTRRQKIQFPLYAVALCLANGLLISFVPIRFAEYYPFAGIDALKAANVRGPIYCHNAWGSLLPFYGHPDWHPTHDGRHFLHARDEWERYFRTAAGETDVNDVVREFRPAAFFLRPGADEGLLERLSIDPNWRLHFRDGTSAIFIPKP